jgi:hypothetical protein
VLFNPASEYAIRNVQESQVGLKLNGSLQRLVYVIDMNLLEITTIKKYTEILIDSNKVVGIEVKEEKSKYI